MSILDGAETHRHNSPEGTTVTTQNLELPTDADTTGTAKKVVSAVTSAASTATGKVREHGPVLAGKAKDTAVKVVTHDRTKSVARDRRVQAGTLVLVVVTLVVVKRRRRG